ncbi:DUF6636 domain-containing protein [Spongisporangium articulatum]|uniref:DUF6636 domain-containing protein n=1 Tax=Spongisporangium articulatum TaxID=3362603 RepID=A0ABW8AQJ8_9ACTN
MLTVVTLAALALAGCGGGSSGGAAVAPSAVSSPSLTASPSPSPTGGGGTIATGEPAPTKAGSANPPAAHVEVRDGSDDEYLSFLTPSGNIHCAIYPGDDDFRKGLVRCDVYKATWTLPPKPKDCEFDWGTVMTLEKTPKAGLCVSDAVDVQGAETVAYGHGLKWHNITCVSQKTGLTCTNTDNKKGFTVSRSAYTLF